MVSELQAQLNAIQRTTVTTLTELGTAKCPSLPRDLWHETSGPDVSALQIFLRNTGTYTYPEITGYFGFQTLNAVQMWQSQNEIAQSYTPGYGRVGPATRAAIQRVCVNGDDAVPVPNIEYLNASTNSGDTPLTVRFTGGVFSGGYSIDYGDGNISEDVGCGHGSCNPDTTYSSINRTHTYTSAGTYVAKLRRHYYNNQGNCEEADCNVVAIQTIVVSESANLSSKFWVTKTDGLKVIFEANYGGNSQYPYTIGFDDGSEREIVSCYAPYDMCLTPDKIVHTYTNPGTYKVRVRTGGGPRSTVPTTIVDTVSVTVTNTVSIPLSCKAWTDECGNRCYRATLRGDASCTLMPCNASNQITPVCTDTFKTETY